MECALRLAKGPSGSGAIEGDHRDRIGGGADPGGGAGGGGGGGIQGGGRGGRREAASSVRHSRSTGPTRASTRLPRRVRDVTLPWRALVGWPSAGGPARISTSPGAMIAAMGPAVRTGTWSCWPSGRVRVEPDSPGEAIARRTLLPVRAATK